MSHEVDVTPFDLGEATSRAAALCLHGLTGTPYEVRPLGVALAAVGIRAVGPTLPGHDQSPAELAAVSYESWIAAVRGDLAALRADHERVFVVGLSLGGLLGLALAAEEPVDGVAVVGTPLRLGGVLRYLVPVVKHVMPFARKRSGSDIRDAVARERHPSYPVMPLASVHELIRLQRVVTAGLARITAPIFVAHGLRDGTANPDDAHEILAGVESAERELLLLEESGHVVPVDRGGERLAEALAGYLARFA